MIKKIVYIGLALIIVSIVMLLFSSSSFTNGIGRSLSSVNTTTGSGNFSSVQIRVNNASLLAVHTILSSAANMYLFNTSTFATWNSYISKNRSRSGLTYARQLTPANSLFVYPNTTVTQIFMSSGSLVANSSNRSKNATFYFVIDNTNGSPSFNKNVSGFVVYIILNSKNLYLYQIISTVALLLFVAGLLVIVFGLLKKDEKTEETNKYLASGKGGGVSKEYIDAIYKNIGKEKGKKKHGQ